MNLTRSRFSKAEKLLLFLNTVLSIALLVWSFVPDLFTQDFFSINIKGFNMPVLLLVNIFFIGFWLIRARLYFLLSFTAVLAFLFTLINEFGLDKIQQDTLTLIMVPDKNSFDEPQQDYIGNDIEIPNHPRLLFTKDQDKVIRSAVSSNENWRKINKIILDGTTTILAEKLKTTGLKDEYIEGPREALRRLLYLSYCWRITNSKQYLDAAISDLLIVSSAQDWRPADYAQTSEALLATSIAYDWLYDELSEVQKILVKKAIVEKGLKPSFDPFYNSWLEEDSDVNQICNTAMIYGALAIYDNDAKLAKQVINRSIASFSHSMKLYSAEGVHPAGYQFGSIATAYNTLALDALKKIFKKDFNLIEGSNFLQAGRYMQNVVGSSGQPFNYADGIPYLEVQPNPAQYWLANHTNAPSITWPLKDVLAHAKNQDMVWNKLLPISLIWAIQYDGNKLQLPREKYFVSKGKDAIALMRTSWDSNKSIFVGFKGGSITNNHSHMDLGSFVMDLNHVRWSTDLGGEPLSKMESKGINVKDISQNSRRWDIFRNNNKSHSTLTVNNGNQNVNAVANIMKFSKNDNFMYAIADLSSVYQPALKKAQRGIAIVDNKFVQVLDEIEPAEENIIRWKIMTPAKINLLSANLAELTQGDKKLYLRVLEPGAIKLQTWVATPRYSYETPNSNETLLGFEIKNNASKKVNISVVMSDDKSKVISIRKIKPLKEW